MQESLLIWKIQSVEEDELTMTQTKVFASLGPFFIQIVTAQKPVNPKASTSSVKSFEWSLR